jgi:hypothetical protein
MKLKNKLDILSIIIVAGINILVNDGPVFRQPRRLRSQKAHDELSRFSVRS